MKASAMKAACIDGGSADGSVPIAKYDWVKNYIDLDLPYATVKKRVHSKAWHTENESQMHRSLPDRKRLRQKAANEAVSRWIKERSRK